LDSRGWDIENKLGARRKKKVKKKKMKKKKCHPDSAQTKLG